MILLDTQLWIWWTTAGGKLSPFHNQYIETHVPDGLAMSAFTVWEVALLEKKGRVDLGAPVAEWAREVVRLPVVHLIPLVPELLIDSVQLPEPFHPDPADRIIVATARHLGCPLLTTDGDILSYTHVRTVGPKE